MSVTASLATVRRPAALRPPHRAATGLGLLAAAIGIASSWVPSLWYDEAATVVSATRSWQALWQMVHHVDAVHAAYYAAMHLWFDLVGYTPFTLRLPSAVAGGIGVALTVHLVDAVASRRIAILSGAVLLMVPRYTWAMTEGRSYALSSTLAILATLLLVTSIHAGRRHQGRRALGLWAAYAVTCALAIICFAYLALLLVAHAVTMLVLVRRRVVTRSTLRAFGAATAIAAVVTLPLIGAIAGQSGQVSWIRSPGWQTLGSVLITQYSPDNAVFATAAWTLIGAATILAFVRPRPARQQLALSARDAVTLVGPILLVPLGMLVATSYISPLYSPRYLTFTTFAFVILIALALDSIIGHGLAVTASALAVLAALSAPSYIAQRRPDAKQESSWAAVAAVVADYAPEEREETAIVFDRLAGHPATTARVIADSYPASFNTLADVDLTRSYMTAATLWGEHRKVRPSDFREMDATWLIASTRSPATVAITTIESAGFFPARTWHLGNVDVTYFLR